jgi:HEAT repeat protein
MNHSLGPRLRNLGAALVALALFVAFRSIDDWTIAKQPPDDWLAAYRKADGTKREELIQSAFVEADGHLGNAALPKLLAWLEDRDAVVRLAASQLLRVVDDPQRESAAPLAKHANDDEPLVRVHCAFSLLHVRVENEPSVTILGQLATKGSLEVRRAAALALELEALNRFRTEPALVDVLRTALRDDDAKIRDLAVWGLSRLEDERALGAVKEAMGDADLLVRTTAAYRVLDAGEPSNDAVAILVEAANSPNESVRLNVLRGASAAPLDRASDVTPLLVAGLRDPSRDLRTAAANGLSKLGQDGIEIPEATDGLIALLDDSDSYTRSCAALALGHVGAEAAVVVPALAKHLEDPEPGTREWVTHSLQQAGPDVVLALPQLIHALDHADPSLRSRAAGLISMAGAAAKGAVDPLVKRLADSSLDVRVWAAFALRSIGPDAIAALPRFETALHEDPEPKMRVESARGIAAFGPLAGRCADLLVAAATKDPDGEVRLWSLFAIGELGVKSETTLAALRDAAKSSDDAVLAEANKALAKLGEEHDAAAIAKEPPPKRELEPIVTRVVYAETAMIVSDANGAAVVDFLDEDETPREGELERHSVKYRFRYLARGQSDATSGTGEVHEAWPRSNGVVATAADPLLQRELRAGPLSVQWSASSKGSGLVHWLPEQMRVEFVHENFYDTLELQRFMR